MHTHAHQFVTQFTLLRIMTGKGARAHVATTNIGHLQQQEFSLHAHVFVLTHRHKKISPVAANLFISVENAC